MLGTNPVAKYRYLQREDLIHYLYTKHLFTSLTFRFEYYFQLYFQLFQLFKNQLFDQLFKDLILPHILILETISTILQISFWYHFTESEIPSSQQPEVTKSRRLRAFSCSGAPGDTIPVGFTCRIEEDCRIGKQSR